MIQTTPEVTNEAVDAYRKCLRLYPVVRSVGQELVSTVKEFAQSTWCLGVHLRHVFDTDAPSVWVSASDDRYKEIRQQTVGQGQQTLNHVLDSLLLPKSGSQQDIQAYVEIEFLKDIRAHVFDFEDTTLEDKGLRQKILGKETGLDSRLACRGTCYKQAALDYSTNEKLSPDEFVCGADKLCKKLEILQAGLNYESIWCAVAQLSRYAEYGSLTATYFLRPRDPFGFVLGFTVIGDEELIAKTRDILIDALKRSYEDLNTYPACLPGSPSREDKRRFESAVTYCGFRFGIPSDHYPANAQLTAESTSLRRLVRTLQEQLSRNKKQTEANQEDKDEHPLRLFREGGGYARATLESFIRIASQFCDERSEGRQLRFGLLLANPDLLFHWKGPSPIPLADESGFVALDKLAKQYHLLDDPEERALVIPYTPAGKCRATTVSALVRLSEPFRCFSLELRHFKQAFGVEVQLKFWAEEFRPYVYFTDRHRWCVGSVAGPYSELRIFFRGQLLAFRDGKGWRLVDDSAGEMTPWETLLAREGLAAFWLGSEGKKLLEKLFRIAFQLSRFVNRKGKGGLILFSPERDLFERLEPDGRLVKGGNLAGRNIDESSDDKASEALVTLNRLRILEPTALEHEQGRNWLRGRYLIDPSRSKNDCDETAHRVIRACSKDGAVVVCGEMGEILEYGVQAVCRREPLEQAPGGKKDQHSGAEQAPGHGGTKHKAAISFVETVMVKQEAALAFCVSEDGEITVFFCASEGGHRTRQQQVFFEKEQYEYG